MSDYHYLMTDNWCESRTLFLIANTITVCKLLCLIWLCWFIFHKHNFITACKSPFFITHHITHARLELQQWPLLDIKNSFSSKGCFIEPGFVGAAKVSITVCCWVTHHCWHRKATCLLVHAPCLTLLLAMFLYLFTQPSVPGLCVLWPVLLSKHGADLTEPILQSTWSCCSLAILKQNRTLSTKQSKIDARNFLLTDYCEALRCHWTTHENNPREYMHTERD